MADRIGQQLDNYRLTRLLGAGGFGEVYLAEHLYRTTQVAIKILPQLAQDDLHSFLIEARTFRLKHPNIVQVLDFGVEGRTPFIVMEYAPNGTLRQRHPKGTRVLLPTIVSYVKQVASALQYAHDERLVHRDVKPENMLIGVQNQVLLSDFGIATIAHGTASQSVEAMAGTIPYMAPEQIQGHPRSASDQYSLGVVVYQWLCGDYPFHGTLTEVAMQHATMPPPSLREKVPAISPDVEQVVMTALAKDPKQRFGSMLAFATALEQASQAKRPEPEPEPVVPVSETTDINQSQQPTEMATPVPVIPFSQQVTVDEVSADTPAQPHTILPLSGAVETIVPPITTPESTPAPATFVLEATPAPPIPEPLSATKAASSPSTSPDVPSILSSAPPVVPSKPGISRSKSIIGLVLVLVLLFGIVGAAKTINRATATDAINSTIAQTNARNIAQLNPALVASNPDPYPPTNGKLTLYDPMHDNTNQGFGWQEDNNCKFTGTAYQVKSGCSAYNIELNNFAFEITVDFTQTSSLQEADVFFRTVGSPDTWYVFSIYNDGTYNFDAGATNLLGATVFPIPSTDSAIKSDAIHQGAQTNIIAIVAIGSTIDLYANGVKINSFNDSSSNYGGMFLSNTGSPVNFSNAKLWTF